MAVRATVIGDDSSRPALVVEVIGSVAIAIGNNFMADR